MVDVPHWPKYRAHYEPPPPREFCTLAEARDKYGVSSTMIRRWDESGLLPNHVGTKPTQAGGYCRLWRVRELEEAIEKILAGKKRNRSNTN